MKNEVRMRNQPAIWFGVLLIFGGLIFLVGNLFHFNPWPFLWPLGLISVGAWLLLRPVLNLPGTASTFLIIGNFTRSGPWQMQSQELYFFIGEVNLDLTQAVIPMGESRLRVVSFIADVKAVIPPGVGVKVSSAGFVSSAHLPDQRRESFLTGFDIESPDYAAADRKLVLEVSGFVSEVRVKGG
jgi:predicted membrane protein